ncbi:MAG: SEL1-like repeat protein [Planctomycetes bacterium]|nr:SEL1-like repeat protein [Planctomycetota bacterium]
MAFTIETQNGERIRVEGDSALIGRDGSCQIALPDQPDLQPIHAKIRKVADRWMIEAQGDWQIQVGTGQPGRMSWIKPGDVIRLTQTGLEITFLDGQPLAQAAPAVSPTVQPPKEWVPEKSRTPAAKAPLPPDLPAAAEEWYYAKDGKKLGPCSVPQLKELAAKGQLAAADLVWKVGLAQWVPAQTIKGLFSTMPPSVPVSPPIRPSQPPAHVPATASPSSKPVKATSSLSGLMPVLIAQTVIASLGVLYGLMGIKHLGVYGLGELDGIFVCLASGWNIAVLTTTWLGYKQRSYWFSLLAARLVFGSWFFFLFTGTVYTGAFDVLPSGFTILGLMISVPVGIWAINVLRKPDVRAFLGSHSEPSGFSHTLLGPFLGNKWNGLNPKQKAITIGAGGVVLLILVPLMLWMQSWRSSSRAKVDSVADYSRGPKGEEIHTRSGPAKDSPNLKEEISGFTAASGKFVHHGKTTAWYDDGSKAWEGRWKDGKMHGKWVYWVPTGKTLKLPGGYVVPSYGETHIFDGQLHGIETNWYDIDRKLKLSQYTYDKGNLLLSVGWSPNGRKTKEIVYQNNKEVERREWDENGKLKPPPSPSTPKEGQFLAEIKTAAEQGDAQAQFKLGVMYHLGIGNLSDIGEAVKWLRKSAEQGNVKALNYLYIYSRQSFPDAPRPLNIDETEAFSWVKKAAEKGDKDSQFDLGYAYENGKGANQFGKGVPNDATQAKAWYEKAASQGDVRAEFGLALLFDRLKNQADSLQWLKKAAGHGHANAQFLLGVEYECGVVVPKDFAEAKRWYEKAVAQGNEEAKKRLERPADSLVGRPESERQRAYEVQADLVQRSRFNAATSVARQLKASLSPPPNTGGGPTSETKKGQGGADAMLKRLARGMSKQDVINFLGQPDVRSPLGKGEAWLYYASETESVFISFDTQGELRDAFKQARKK